MDDGCLLFVVTLASRAERQAESMIIFDWL